MLCALIMAGGKGTRFWPISTENKPKQFLNLIGEDTMLQMTYKRINKLISSDKIFICTSDQYIHLVKEQIPNIQSQNIIREPDTRNTAPCIALSALIISRYYKESTMIVLPSDHLVNNTDLFVEIISKCYNFLKLKSDSIITLGITPNRPECGYGYIKFSANSSTEYALAKKVESFIEKPNAEKAVSYLNDGNYLWNSGIFLWNTNSILEKIKKYIPNTYEALYKILECSNQDINNIIDNNYALTDKISIDYAVLEKDDDIYVVPSDIMWDDIGTWQAVERYKVKDINRNISVGRTSYIDGANNIVVSSGKQIIVDGLSDIYVIESEDKIIVGWKKNINTVNNLKRKIMGK